MNEQQNYTYATVVADASEVERKAFYKQTYIHLAGALMTTVILEAIILPTQFAVNFSYKFTDNFWIAFILFIGASWIGGSMAYSRDKTKQYIGLGVYVLTYTLFFIPILLFTAQYLGTQIINEAAIITTFLFAGLTFTAFTMKTDFSFLGGALRIGSFIILGIIVASFFIGGLTNSIFWVGFVMLFLGGLILYETSQIRYKYATDMHVGAAATLYGSFMTLFLYVLRLLSILRGD